MIPIKSWPLIVLVSVLSVLCGGCGSNNSSSNNLSQAQSQAVTQELSLALDQALTNAFGANAARDVQPSLATAVSGIRPDTPSGCTPTPNGENCSWPVSYDGPCPGGGTIAVTGDIDGSLNDSGGGSIQTQFAITPTNCSVSNLVINGDPDVSVASQLNFTNSAPVYPIVLTETGGVSYGPRPSGSCQFNVTYTINSQTSCTIAGTACGQSVNGSC